MTYTYTDREGDELTIEPCSLFGETASLTSATGACVPVADLPKIVAELYKAAGLPNPLADHPRQHVMQSVVDRRDLVIEPSIRAEGAVYFGQSSARGWHIRVEDLPELVGALYKAAGQEPPILLPRLEWHGSDRRVHSFNGVLVERVGKSIRILSTTWSATTARGVARVLAELADAADAEPDPEKLADLAAVLRKAGVLGEAREEIARAVLGAGYTRSES
jgi:hypothetical protein